MTERTHTSQRIVIVGGGVAGLSVAVRLAQAGLPVTVLEASELGFGASTRNQGWLHSGASFALQDLELARRCHQSLQQTLAFCPECLEPQSGPMVYLMTGSDTDPARWTAAWDAAEINYAPLTQADIQQRFPAMAAFPVAHAFELPDRAIQSQVLLRRLAETAANAGAEVRPQTSVRTLRIHNDAVDGVETADGETIPARLVILAGNATGGALVPGFGAEAVGTESNLALVMLKTHLAAVQPMVTPWPLCVLDADGFNHLPHQQTSVFGSSRWIDARHGEDQDIVPAELERLWALVGRVFPDVDRSKLGVSEWAASTVQATPVEQLQAGKPPVPTIVDHQQEYVRTRNLLSVFPGRASLWPYVAEQTQQTVLQKLESAKARIAAPPWSSKKAANE